MLSIINKMEDDKQTVEYSDIIEEQGVDWVSVSRNTMLEVTTNNRNGDYIRNLKIDKTFTKVKNPPHFKVLLLEHQKAIIMAMIDLERKRFIDIDNGAFILETSAGVLSDKLGSGKTYDILGLISWSKCLPSSKYAIITAVGKAQSSAIQSNRFSSYNKFICYDNEFKRVYKKYLPINLIFVGKSVIKQWMVAITTNTTLKVFVISDIYSLKKFYSMIFTPTRENNIKTLLEYDIILIKNGQVSGSFNPVEIRDSFLSNNKILSILSVF